MYPYSYGNFSGFIPPSREHYILGSVYALISFFGVVGNGLVILAVLRNRSLQTSTNAFIVNLAFADLLTSAALSVYVVSFWSSIFSSVLDSLCALSTGLLRSFISSSTLNLAAISLNRLVIVIQAKRTYQWLFTKKSLIIWITFTWIYGIPLSFMPHFIGVIRLGFVLRAHQCGIQPLNEGDSSVSIAHSFHAIGSYPLQFITIMVCYTWVYIFVYRQYRRMLKYAQSEPIQIISRVSNADRNISRKSRSAFWKQVDITKNLFYILCAFVICLSPHMICSMFGCVNIFTKTLTTVNSMVNPFIYSINHPQFRKAFVSMIGRHRSENDAEQKNYFPKSQNPLGKCPRNSTVEDTGV